MSSDSSRNQGPEKVFGCHQGWLFVSIRSKSHANARRGILKTKRSQVNYALLTSAFLKVLYGTNYQADSDSRKLNIREVVSAVFDINT